MAEGRCIIGSITERPGTISEISSRMIRVNAGKFDVALFKPLAKAGCEPDLSINGVMAITAGGDRLGEWRDISCEGSHRGFGKHYVLIDNMLHGRLLSPLGAAEGVWTISL